MRVRTSVEWLDQLGGKWFFSQLSYVLASLSPRPAPIQTTRNPTSGNLWRFDDGSCRLPVVRLATYMHHSGNFHADVARIRELERAGLDIVWVPEAYSIDAISRVGYLAANTDRVLIGSGVLNVFSRTPTAVAQTAAGCDLVSDGRFILGLGASGPQVIEGFHGVPYEKPMQRIREYIEICRRAMRREAVIFDGETVQIPLAKGRGTGLGKPLKFIDRPIRAEIPVFWASLMPRSVTETAKIADGWLPLFFDPEKYRQVWGDALRKGLAERQPSLGRLEISAGGMVAIGDEFAGGGADQVLDLDRERIALYVGGMGARQKNFYNEIATRYGYPDEAAEIQDLYLSGRKLEAAKIVPRDFLAGINLVGPKSYVAERLAAYREAGVTVLEVNAVAGDPIKTMEVLRSLVD